MIYFPLMLTLLVVGPAIAAIAMLRSLSIRWNLALLSLCLFYGVFPLFLTWGGLHLAERFDCRAEAIRYYCSAPAWHSNLVTGLVFAHWLAIFTIPSAVLGAIGLLISSILKVKRSRTTGDILEKPPAAFYRSRRHKVIAGVCAAIAQRWQLPLQGVRIVTVVLAIVIPGFVFLYPWLWLAFPLSPPIESDCQPIKSP
jgi:phage shock protein C